LTQTRQQALECEPLVKLGNITLNPCGVIANTLFNDVFTLNNDNLIMQEKGIAWTSDLEYMFAQPEGFSAEICPNATGCTAACCDGDEWSCEEPYVNKEDGECYRYFYPNDNTTQYLYEVSMSVVLKDCLMCVCVSLSPTENHTTLDLPTSSESIGRRHE